MDKQQRYVIKCLKDFVKKQGGRPEAAKVLGCTPAAISFWLRGKKEMSVVFCGQLATLGMYNVSQMHAAYRKEIIDYIKKTC